MPSFASVIATAHVIPHHGCLPQSIIWLIKAIKLVLVFFSNVAVASGPFSAKAGVGGNSRRAKQAT